MLFYAIFAVALVVIDQLTKLLTRACIAPGQRVTLIPGLLDLTYVENTGAAFSILERHTWLLTVVSAVVVLIVAWLMLRKFFTNRLGMFAAALILSGGVGNLIDRAVFKYVTDMIMTTFMEFPVFNFADCCITVGVVLLVIYVLFFCRDEKKEGDHGADRSDRT